jgi:hypothetical protein
MTTSVNSSSGLMTNSSLANPATLNVLKFKASDALNKVSNGFNKAGEAVKNFFPSFFKSNTNSSSNKNSYLFMLALIVSTLLLIFIIIYVVKKIKNSTLKSKAFVSTPTQPSSDSMQFVATDNEIPSLNNGSEFAYSFWIYVDSLDDVSNHKLIFLQSNSSDTEDVAFKNAYIVAYIAKNSNKLKFKIRTSNADQHDVYIDNSSTDTEGIDGPLYIDAVKSDSITLDTDKCYYSEYSIDYLPTQKWTNVIINVENNFVSIFLDGELLSTHNLASSDSSSSCTDSYLSNILSVKSGSIFTGSDKVTNKLYAFNGYLSTFNVFNYSITLDNVKAIYDKGPISKSAVMGNYGLRNPLYRIDEIKA